MYRNAIILFLIISFIFFNPLFSTVSIENVSAQNNVDLQKKITKLSVSIQSNTSIFYNAVIQIYNPSNSIVTLNHDSWCGFEVELDPRINANYTSISGYSTCNLPYGTFPRTYQPGYTYQNYNASSTLILQGDSSTDLPIGFYYFDLLINTFSPPYISVPAALFLYYGNGSSQTQYNINTTYDDRPNSGSPFIFEELSSYSKSLQESSTQSTNNQPNSVDFLLLLVPLAVLLIVFGFIYMRRPKTINNKKEYSPKYIESKKSQTNYNEPQFESMFSSEEEESYLRYCQNCHFQVDKNDIFCDNCGSRLEK